MYHPYKHTGKNCNHHKTKAIDAGFLRSMNKKLNTYIMHVIIIIIIIMIIMNSSGSVKVKEYVQNVSL